MRFIKQKDNYACGIVGILNSLKWAGYKHITRDTHFMYFKELCKAHFKKGTKDEEITKVFRKYRRLLNFKEKSCVKEKDIYNYFTQKNQNSEKKSALVNFVHTIKSDTQGINSKGHFFFISKFIPQHDSYEVVNFDGKTGKTTRLVTRQELRNSISLLFDSKYPKMWSLERKK